MDLEEIIGKYIKEHAVEIASKVDQEFQNTKEDIKFKIIQKIKSFLDPLPIHYEWDYDGNPYDYSGIIVKNGFVNIDQTVSEFLKNEYTGRQVPTFTSRYGYHYCTYGDELSYTTKDISEDILHDITKVQVENVFGNITEDLFLDVMNFHHDDVYEKCIAFWFFDYEPAIKFVGIGELTLAQVKEM